MTKINYFDINIAPFCCIPRFFSSGYAEFNDASPSPFLVCMLTAMRSLHSTNIFGINF